MFDLLRPPGRLLRLTNPRGAAPRAVMESERPRAVARGHGGFSADRLYIDNISSVNRTLAIVNRDRQGWSRASPHPIDPYTCPREEVCRSHRLVRRWRCLGTESTSRAQGSSRDH